MGFKISIQVKKKAIFACVTVEAEAEFFYSLCSFKISLLLFFMPLMIEIKSTERNTKPQKFNTFLAMKNNKRIWFWIWWLSSLNTSTHVSLCLSVCLRPSVRPFVLSWISGFSSFEIIFISTDRKPSSFFFLPQIKTRPTEKTGGRRTK